MLALAGPIQTHPAPALQLAPCTADPDAGCWSAAATATHFAPPPGMPGASVDVDVRLAHHLGDLVVRVPAGRTVEVTIGTRPDDTRRSASVVVGAGAHLISVADPLAQGERRWFHLALLDGDRALPWAPGGLVPDPWRGFPALVVDAAVDGPAIEVGLDRGLLTVEAAGASRVRVEEEAMELLSPAEAEDVPPFTAAGEGDRLVIPVPPQRGWFTIEASAPGSLTRRRLYLPGVPPPGLVEAGLHPRPADLVYRRGELDVRSVDEICYEPAFAAPAALLRDEVARLSGRVLTLRACDGARSLRVRRGPTEPEGFHLDVDRRGATVTATDLRGATYGVLALADGLGLDGRLRALSAADAPELGLRVLFHRIDARHRGEWDVDRYIAFVRQVVARGRYNTLVLGVRGAYRYASHPELAAGSWALDRADLERVIAAARDLGLDVIPGANSPAHADWILDSHPELAEGRRRAQLCTRHPGSRALIEDVYTELRDVFGAPPWLHVGHDEVRWARARQAPGDRCPRCSGATPAALFEEYLRWELAALGDARLMLWGDMLVPGWNGGPEGVHEAIRALPADAVVLTWSDRGSAVQTLLDAGLQVVHTPTGNVDARRFPIARHADRLAGAGLALWQPSPWNPHGWGPDEKGLWYHWPQVVLAGVTAWRPSLAVAPIAPTLASLSGESSYLPGFRADSLASVPAAVRGERVDLAVVPTMVKVGGRAFVSSGVVVDPEIDVGFAIAGASILQAVRLDRDADRRLASASRRSATRDGVPVAALEVRWVDGESAEVPLFYGVDTWDPAAPPAAMSLWRSAGAVHAPSPYLAAIAPDEADRTLYRWDWANPRPDVAVARLRLVPRVAGATVFVAGAALLTAE